MYVAAYCDRSVDLHNICLFYKEFAGLVANFADLWFGYDLAGAEL